LIEHSSACRPPDKGGGAKRRGVLLFALLAALAAPAAWAAHAYAQFGDIKYPKGFAHFEWVNPDAPKGGELSLVPPLRITNLDKLNPFTLKGVSPPGIGGLVIETLLTGTLDEPTTAYGLLAEDVEVALDKLSVTFRPNPAARFHNGQPVLAEDVKYSFERLMSKEASPAYRVVYADVKRAVVVGPRTVRFDLARASAELPLLVGGLPAFSRDWGAGKPFDKVVTDVPIGSGPYRIARWNDHDVTYERDPNYWARELGVRRGMYNFDRVTYKIYKDNTAQTEAFKAGEFDYIRSFSAREWARLFTGKKFDSGELIKAELPFKNAGDFQAYLINIRRDKFKDVRVREALDLAFDFEWLDRRLMYQSYLRSRSYFNNSDFEAKGMPAPDELAILEPLRKKLSPKVFNEPVPLPPTTDPPGSLRANLEKARDLLAQAGWTYRDGALRNAKGEPFVMEFMDSGGDERVMTVYIQALAKLGIELQYRRADFALYQKRLDTFDFDLFTLRIPGNEAPGADLVDFLGSQSADTQGSTNWIGVHDPAVDEILKLVIAAKTRPELVASLRALDRVLRFGHYVVPQWFSKTFRVAYRAGKFEQPQVPPLYYAPDDWLVSTWWRKR
jgi:microcin C transport system substrate-binding protein